MSWITREFQFSKSQAEREFNCPLYKNYVRIAKTAKGTKWQRDPRTKLLSKFCLVENPCQPTFLFCNRKKAEEFFVKDWAKRKSQQKEPANKTMLPKREQSPEKATHLTASNQVESRLNVKVSSAITPSSILKSQLLAPSTASMAKQDKTKKIGVFIRGFK